MRVWLNVLFVVGMVVGLFLGIFAIFWIALIKGRRAVHAEGIVVRAEVTAKDTQIGPRLAGPAIVRLSGAFGGQTAIHAVLGIEMRFQKVPSDPSVGDQDLSFGTFKSFHTAIADQAATEAGDYMANKYSSVTPWWTDPLGAVTYHLAPVASGPRGRGDDRLSRLVADIADDRARFTILAGETTPIAEIRLIERIDSASDAAPLKVSMFNHHRGINPVGARNGIRAVVYPISQFARRLRGG